MYLRVELTKYRWYDHEDDSHTECADGKQPRVEFCADTLHSYNVLQRHGRTYEYAPDTPDHRYTGKRRQTDTHNWKRQLLPVLLSLPYNGGSSEATTPNIKKPTFHNYS